MKTYTAVEAARVLQITQNGLRFMIKKYKLTVLRGEKWNRKLFLKAEVDALADRPRTRRMSCEPAATTHMDRHGYTQRYYPLHPGCNSSGCVGEHRLVMEEVLGRILTDSEVVHHRDGNRANNDPSNLELFQCRGSHLKKGHALDGFFKRWSYILMSAENPESHITKLTKELKQELKLARAS